MGKSTPMYDEKARCKCEVDGFENRDMAVDRDPGGGVRHSLQDLYDPSGRTYRLFLPMVEFC